MSILQDKSNTDIKTGTISFNLVMNMLLTVSTVVFPLITTPYISRILLPEGTGKLAFATSVISYFTMFSMLGIPTYGVRACAKVRDDKELLSKTVQEIWFINLIATAVSYIALFSAIFLIPQLRAESHLIMIMSATLFLNSLAMEWVYRALEQYRYITVRSLIFKFISVILMFAFVHTSKDYCKYALILVTASTGNGILNFLNLKKYIILKHFSDYQIKKHLKPILVFFSMSVATTIYLNLDVAMLGFMTDVSEVGYYDIAVKIKRILVEVVTSLGVVMLPRVSYYIEQNRRTDFDRVCSKAIEFVLCVAVPLSVIFIILANPCIRVLSGDMYLPAVPAMQIIMPTLVLIGLTNVMGIQVLVPLGKERMVLHSEILGALTDVLLNFIFIPMYGAAGAAFGTLCAELSVLIYQTFALKDMTRHLFKGIHWISIIAGTLLAAIASCMAGIMLNLPAIILLFLQLCVFFGVYGVFELICKEPTVMQILEFARAIISRIEPTHKTEETIYLIGYTMYILMAMMFGSKYGEMPQLHFVFVIMRLIPYMIICGKIGVDIIMGRFSVKEICICTIITGIVGITTLTSGNKNILIFWLFIMAAHNVSFQRIVKWSLAVHLIGLLFIIGSSYLGIIENHIYDPTDRKRETLGFSCVTESCNYWMYTVLLWIYTRKRNIRWIEIGVIILITAGLYLKTDTKSATAVAFAATTGCVMLKYLLCLRNWHKGYAWIGYLLMPSLTFFICYFSWRFSWYDAFTAKLNLLTTGRLAMGQSGIADYGIHFLGQKILWIGADDLSGHVYNYVDSSYLQILLNFGILFYGLVLAAFIYLVRVISVKRDTWLLLCIGFMMLHAAFDPQLVLIQYDTFILIYAYVKGNNNASVVKE